MFTKLLSGLFGAVMLLAAVFGVTDAAKAQQTALMVTDIGFVSHVTAGMGIHYINPKMLKIPAT